MKTIGLLVASLTLTVFLVGCAVKSTQETKERYNRIIREIK